MDFRFRHLRFFLEVAKELHFSRAAENMGIAQPALSRAIRDLEANLGVVLFIRGTRKVELTDAGQAFVNDCKAVLNAANLAVQNVRLVNEGSLGSLRIGYTDMAIAGCLPQILTKFQAQYENISLQPHMDPTIYQLDRLEKDEIDIGFVTGPIQVEVLIQHPVQSERFVCVVYDSHPLAHRKSIRLEELAGENFVLGPPKEWEHFYSYLLPMCRKAGFLPHTAQQAYNTTGIIGLIACGVGITIHTESVINCLRDGVSAIPISTSEITENLVTVAIWKENKISGPLAKFVKFIRDQSEG